MTEEASPRRRRQVIDALRRGFATAEVQISETQTPLHRLETVHRRITEALRTAAYPPSAFRMILDCWFYTQESDAVAAAPALATAGQDQVSSAVTRLLEQRLGHLGGGAAMTAGVAVELEHRPVEVLHAGVPGQSDPADRKPFVSVRGKPAVLGDLAQVELPGERILPARTVGSHFP